jgi:NitT/TauT family transport system ATP-binding protein
VAGTRARSIAMPRRRRAKRPTSTRDGPVESLRPLTFDIGDGEFMAIVGPSGCGKSTLLKMVAGLLPASAADPLSAARSTARRRRRHRVPEPGAARLAHGARQRAAADRDAALCRARIPAEGAALLAMTGLAGFERKYPWQLSGGMQQRASICRALVHDPACC